MNIWQGIPELIAVVETGSFSAAAQQLGVSTSHVSRQVAQLEERLGVRLLSRSTRTIRLTEAGAEYYQRCAELTVGLEIANQQVTQNAVELVGRLRITLAGAFAEQYVAPVLVNFVKLHPKIQMELNFNSRRINLIEEGFDFAIRYGTIDESGLTVHKLVERKLVACASPDYLKQRGRPIDPEELKDHACLRTNANRWRFRYPEGYRYVPIAGPWVSNNVPAVVAAAVGGLGILYLPRSSLTNELKSGTLIPLLQDYCDMEATTWIVYPNSRHLPLRVNRAVQFLLEQFHNHWQD